jgi:hypothetical protein
MAILCLLPRACRACLKEALGQNYYYLFDAALSDPSCTYWKAKVAGFLYQRYQDLTPEQTENVIWSLFGVTNNVKELCVSTCILLSNTFNNILGLGNNLFLNGLSKASGLLDLANVARMNDASSMASSVKTVKSFKSFKSDPVTKVRGFEMFNPETVRAVAKRKDEDAFEDAESGPGSKRSEISETPNSTAFSDDSDMDQDEDLPNQDSNYIGLNTPMSEGLLQQIRTRQKIGEGGRKSRRHKKRKSTLKRRRIKRRRTRKGKKRRHTRKH